MDFRGDAVVHKGDLYHGVKVLPATTRTAEEIADDEENQDQEEGWLDGEDLYDEKMQVLFFVSYLLDCIYNNTTLYF